MHSKFLAERPARWAPYGQNNFSQRYRTLVEHFSLFLQKWRAKVEVRFLRYCVDPNAPRTGPRSRWMLMAADAQAEADGGDDEAPQDVESDDGSVAGSSPGGSSPHSSQGQPGSVEGGVTGSPVSRNLGTDFYSAHCQCCQCQWHALPVALAVLSASLMSATGYKKTRRSLT